MRRLSRATNQSRVQRLLLAKIVDYIVSRLLTTRTPFCLEQSACCAGRRVGLWLGRFRCLAGLFLSPRTRLNSRWLGGGYGSGLKQFLAGQRYLFARRRGGGANLIATGKKCSERLLGLYSLLTVAKSEPHHQAIPP